MGKLNRPVTRKQESWIITACITIVVPVLVWLVVTAMIYTATKEASFEAKCTANNGVVVEIHSSYNLTCIPANLIIPVE